MSKSSLKLLFKPAIGLSIVLISLLTLIKNNNSVLAADFVLQDSSYFPSLEDQKKYQSIVHNASASNLGEAEMGKIVQQVAKEFLGAKYTAGLLDRSMYETLIISLQEFDCLLFIETVLAIANNIKQQTYSYQAFSQGVENQRYWNGKMNGYCSRLHYFSDWIEDNQRRGNVQNITKKLGGIDTVKKLNFMTAHRDSYPNLVRSDANFECIASVEASLSDKFNYIPTHKIGQAYSQLRSGDVVGVATDIPGLDFTHTGFVYHQSDGKIGLIHASPAGEVVIAQDLQTYVSKVDRAIGIVVSRPNP